MRAMIPGKLSAGRIRTGPFGSDDSWGCSGCFQIPGPCNVTLRIIASDASDPIAEGWEHVSVSLPKRCPNWPEMAFVKDLFWSPEETVVQLHPPESEYISNHPFCLHLWRDTRNSHALPPSILVGIKAAGDVSDDPAKQDAIRRMVAAL